MMEIVVSARSAIKRAAKKEGLIVNTDQDLKGALDQDRPTEVHFFDDLAKGIVAHETYPAIRASSAARVPPG